MIQPIAVLFYQELADWKNPKMIEVHEFDVENSIISPMDIGRWTKFKDEKKKETGLDVGWCKREDLDQADAAIAYWEECR